MLVKPGGLIFRWRSVAERISYPVQVRGGSSGAAPQPWMPQVARWGQRVRVPVAANDNPLPWTVAIRKLLGLLLLLGLSGWLLSGLWAT